MLEIAHEAMVFGLTELYRLLSVVLIADMEMSDLCVALLVAFVAQRVPFLLDWFRDWCRGGSTLASTGHGLSNSVFVVVDSAR